jgi:hypothetical protein
MTTTALNGSQRVTLRMFADARHGAMDVRGLGIPGGTIGSLKRRGLIEHRSLFGPATEYRLTRDGWDSVRADPEYDGAPASPVDHHTPEEP